ncbi:helix-turn-helix domain-containing protein [Lactiplantibacillus pentosus]|uniref:helix-turn-helix domain-containing protein n=1 Tax=Lactiplantibacillus pentosus TaxID=1589 RepID=UPI00133107F1|nr:helix-turn-helix domain-containing protein [Lactiplantibacillus pentosus]MBQ0835768.1 helix-turn-helix transcriptional regulator [Lactiplantibacillus pentosus]MBU7465242.1 helix-turn-helix transcriptional regulator [Lactiplantibacillus pentosus]MBU7491210.1 helix-turn-helix transcriptional regulator [Lactiplantibacillus pentosus]MBU7493731.1 helix-turn-helix transcriptional regulator [Lactiplantibacillus pentosus]MBU7519786.1 helix-turn-helix transcriptional regulator [Lactiplantibacillus p
MGTEIQFVQYLHQMRDYNDQHPTTKGLILLGYLERDFIRFYRAGKVEEGIRFVKENLTRSRDLLNKLSSEEKQLQLSALVDVLAFEGMQNHAEIYEFVQLRNDYHHWLDKLPVTTERYQPLVVQIIRDFAAIAQPNALTYNAHLESTLDVLYYTNAHLHDHLTVKKVLAHVNQRCNPETVRRAFSQEMHMSIRDYINAKKIQEAEHMLLATDLTIRAIAAELSFYDAADFSKRFKKETGQTPLEYRQENTRRA